MRFLKGLLSTLLIPALLVSLNAHADVLRLATTTSTYNSGLLDYLLPEFEKSQGTEIQVIAVGTGKALRMGQDGDVDVVLVHAPKAEQTFVDKGYGIERSNIMYNDFVILGPEADPAGIKGMKDAGAALSKISSSQSIFVSRGDDSGTHKKELGIWAQSGIKPAGNWYREAGQGMGKVLQITDELKGYTLVDRGTWLAYRNKLELKLLVEGDKGLHNPYAVIRVNPKRYPDLNHPKAIAFSQWLASATTQQRIGEFKVGGEQLFVPSAH
ncbi:MAG: substrate-binding domain-containing protein [Motiliproteus sp.]